MSFALSDTDEYRLAPPMHADLARLMRAVAALPNLPFKFCIAQAYRSAQYEFNLWLACHNADGTRNAAPWRTNCNGYAVGTNSPQGIPGTGVSNHQGGLAVDVEIIVNGVGTWDLKYYKQFADIVLATAKGLGIAAKWGGTFVDHDGKPCPDSGHFELDNTVYEGTYK